jgi:TonB family protein
MPSEAEFAARGEARDRSYRRGLHRALAVSFAFHLAFVLYLNPAPLRWIFGPRVTLGYPGQPRHGELAPWGEPREQRSSSLNPQTRRGPIFLIRLSRAGTIANPDIAEERSTRHTVGMYQPGRLTRGRPGEPHPGEPGGDLVIELDEGWTAIRGSSDVAHSEKLQILKAVRPDYPRSAIQAGIEGLVRLEVRVDSLGNVADVRTTENTSGSTTLEDAAVQAMRKWAFKPLLVEHRAIPFTVSVPFRYRLLD